MVPRREGKGLVLRGSAHVTCPLPALLSRAKCRGPGSGCPAANREGLCASWQELGRARRCWVGAGRALGQSGLRSWAGSAASTFLGLPGSGCVCGRRASAWQLLTFPTAHPDGPTLPPGNLDPTVSWPSLPRPPPGRSPTSRAASPALPPGRVLSPGSCWTPRDRVPARTIPAGRPLLGFCMAGPGALSFPCPTLGAARGQHCCSLGKQQGTGTGRMRGWGKRRTGGSPFSPSTQAQGMHLC